MREFIRNCIAACILAALFVPLEWIIGSTPDGILYGQWLDNNDHPTNWYDTAAHPAAR
jgi:hypothetical protein